MSPCVSICRFDLSRFAIGFLSRIEPFLPLIPPTNTNPRPRMVRTQFHSMLYFCIRLLMTTKALVHQSKLYHRTSVLRFKLECPPICSFRLVVLVQSLGHPRQPQPGPFIVWVQFGCVEKGLCGVFDSTATLMPLTNVVPSPGVIRFDFDSL